MDKERKGEKRDSEGKFLNNVQVQQPAVDMEGLFQEASGSFRSTLESWLPDFQQSQAFEEQVPKHLEAIIENAKAMEQQLKQQKENVSTSLQSVAASLQSDNS